MVSPQNNPIWMIRENWDGLPVFALPEGYSFRWYQPGDEAEWVRIQLAACSQIQLEAGAFARIFGRDAAALAQRQCFLLDSQQNAVGTATAWFDDNFNGKLYGRVHWVAIERDHQGRGLAKPLLSMICQRLWELGHDRAYLKTYAEWTAAIALYRRFGFVQR